MVKRIKRIIILPILLLTTFTLFPEETKNLELEPDNYPEQTITLPLISLNTNADFNDVIPQKTYVFMVGNNKYLKTSGYDELKQCHNDILLLKQIFIHCSKIDPLCIYAYYDLTLSESRSVFQAFTQNLDKQSRVIIYYSGHGARDGSLVFTDGGKLEPGYIRQIVNSFENDTILITDACYSGINDSPYSEIESPFKKNSQRLYSTLAYLQAKEIEYNDLFFKRIMPFYKEVLRIDDIPGNGYFTALFGIAFAYYTFGKKNNTSFATLISSMSNITKDYLEYLDQKRSFEKLELRSGQLPRIFPEDAAVEFNIPYHKHIVLKRKYRPAGNYWSVSINPNAALPVNINNFDPGVMVTADIHYNFNLNENGIIGIGFQSGMEWNVVTRNNTDESFDHYIFPFALTIRYITNFSHPLFFQGDVGCGAALFLSQLKEDQNIEGNIKNIAFYNTLGIGIGFNPVQTFGIAASCNVYFGADSVLVYPGINLSYNF